MSFFFDRVNNILTIARNKKYLLVGSILLVIAIPFIYRPSRLLYPQLFGMTCPSSNLCVDNVAKLAQARNLVQRNSPKVALKLSATKHQPKFVFCSTQKCWQSFGFNKAAAITLGKTAIAIAPRGWKDFYIQHELIHYWQAEKIGLIKMLFAPQWFVEGMAYSLSEDPRILTEPFNSYKQQFESWYSEIEPDDFLKTIQQEI